ncbi:MAG: hypothetical protein KDK55_05345 [Chlamydiia bacterium]|nr:hypothetical protein [Chlamydiia bacterium]
MKSDENKRVFFGLQIDAPWPENLPAGELLAEKDRHATLAFLGDVHFPLLKSALARFPPPPFRVGFCGRFDKVLLLPPHHPRLVAWNMQFGEEIQKLIDYQTLLSTWLKKEGLIFNKKHNFTPHVTMCRRPHALRDWKKKFSPLPFITTHLHLYESLGQLRYQPIWSYPLLPPFKEIDHTADFGFEIFGESLLHLFSHAQIALCFIFPPLIDFLITPSRLETHEDVIIALNELVSHADIELGIPFKAVSFHGNLKQKNTIYSWEMILDV